MLKKTASVVLASLRGLNVPKRTPFASSLAAALLSGLFEHPAWYSLVVPDAQVSDVFACLQSFSAAC